MDIEDTSEFVHTPLGPEDDALRFVSVEPCFDATDQIVCTLHDSRISENDGYTALSYMWGPPSDGQFPILLNGAEYFVRANLWRFLLYARDVLPGRYLWIDAICINQAHTKERNHQVNIMGDIYSNANRVVAWLGEADLNLIALFEDIQRWQRCYKLFPTTDEPVRSAPDRQRRLYLHAGLPTRLSYLSWIPPRLVHFLLLAYWQRTWIVQEILLAKRLSFVCGDKMLDYDVLMMELFAYPRPSIEDEELVAVEELISWHAKLMSLSRGTAPSAPLPPSLELLLRRSDPHKQIRDLEMKNIIDVMDRTECSDPRDRILAHSH